MIRPCVVEIHTAEGDVKRYRIRAARSDMSDCGRCLYARGRRCGAIVIRRGMTFEETMQTVIHEILHASLPMASEEWVQSTENAIAAALLETGLVKAPTEH